MKRTKIALLTAFVLAGPRLQAQEPPRRSDFVASDVLNKELPSWLRFSGEYRMRMEGFTGGGFKDNNSDLYLLDRVRLNMKIQPTAWLKFVVQGQDARPFGKNPPAAVPPFKDTMDLRLGYVELGDSENGTLGLRVGRLELAFGDERLVGNSNWGNTARSFDGIRVTFRQPGIRLDAFASSVVTIREGKFDRSVAGNNLYGVYSVLDKLVPKATFEPYFFWRRAPNLLTKAATRGNLNFATIGLRWVGKLPAHFDYGTEMTGQTGSLGSDRIGAWAGHWIVGYTVARARFTPRIVAEYNFASGDKDPHAGTRGTFDHLYPTPHDKYGLADQVGWKNIHHLRTGIELKPRSKWLVTGKYSSWWLASPRDALYSAGGAVLARVPDGSAGRFVGQELDSQAVYTLSKQVQLAGGYGYLSPGTFLRKATPGRAYSFPYLSFSYLF